MTIEAFTPQLDNSFFIEAPHTADRIRSLFELLGGIVLPLKLSGIDAFGVDDFDDPGVELEEDIDIPGNEVSQDYTAELEEDDDSAASIGNKPNFVASIGDVLKCKVGAVDWIFPGMLREGTVAMLVGFAGCGKSTFALKLIDAIARGKLFLGHQCVKRPVLYLDRDGNSLGDVQDRLRWLQIKYGGRFKYWGANAPDVPVPLPDDNTIREWVNILDQRPVIVCDSFGHFLEGGDENSAKDVNRLWKQISDLKQAGCAFIFLHHKNKNAETLDPFRGSTAIRAGIDYGFLVENRSPAQLLTNMQIKRIKSRSAAPFGDDEGVLNLRIGIDGSFAAAEKTKRESSEGDGKLWSIMKENPGIGSVRLTELAKSAGITKARTQLWRQARLNDGSAVQRKGSKGNSLEFWLAEDAPPEDAASDLTRGMLPDPVVD